MKNFIIILTTLVLTVCILLIGFYWILFKPWNSDFNPEALIEKYSEEEIDHFALFAFQNDRLRKWTKDILIDLEFENGLDSSVIISAKTCISTLEPLLGEIKIGLNETDHNVLIKAVDSMKWMMSYGYTTHTFNPVAIPYPTISNGEVVVKYDQGITTMHSRIHYSLGHILGFDQNLESYRQSNWTYKSWFNSPTTTYIDSVDKSVEDLSDFTDLDKAAIKIMYDPDVAIDPGLTKEKFYRLIDEARKMMRTHF